MQYTSTRGAATRVDFRTVVLSGLAEDGGLYVPVSLPQFSANEIANWSWLPFDELAWRVISPFVGDSIDEASLRSLVSDSYSRFRHRAIAPLQQIGHNEWVLQLFHGPTRASKDFAAQLQMRLVQHFLGENGDRAMLVGASNGDTAVAAIEALDACPGARLLALYPRTGTPGDRMAILQAADSGRVCALAVDGSFDDCQSLVSRLFRQWPLPDVVPISFNSTNWVGVLAQIVFYFHAALQLGGGLRPVGFSVPAASFAEIYAGFIAQKMGLPINQIIVSTNRNDALHQFIHSNRYNTGSSSHTLSPAMDFSLFSNLERFVWELYERNGPATRALMEHFEYCGELSIGNRQWLQARMLFDSYAVGDAQTREEIATLFRETGCAVDPHTATGAFAGRLHRRNIGAPMVTLGQIAPEKSAALLAELGAWHGEVPASAALGAPARVLGRDDLQGLGEILAQLQAGR
ncbi:Threonine synthase [Pseudomonas knackmussii B13]|uniref:Threonine synthase n=1 Tax=Pseudomonas knackmussii (strain DSM 6978 / CCUG 54928 / LMG 23759 / B13) TaxID=1301098 RepID=A0A024HF03_PSEKB|nr:threonine synthase [Pseudomonas knackmussii]CDF83605.1 Threonine synthase [Pseudomonas knackmussii B13]